MFEHHRGLRRPDGGAELVGRRLSDAADRAKAANKDFAGSGANAWDTVKDARGLAFAAEDRLVGDGKTVSLVAHALQELEDVAGVREQDGFEGVAGDGAGEGVGVEFFDLLLGFFGFCLRAFCFCFCRRCGLSCWRKHLILFSRTRFLCFCWRVIQILFRRTLSRC